MSAALPTPRLPPGTAVDLLTESGDLLAILNGIDGLEVRSRPAGDARPSSASQSVLIIEQRDGLDALSSFSARDPRRPMIAVLPDDSYENVAAALEAGAHETIPRAGLTPERMRHAIVQAATRARVRSHRIEGGAYQRLEERVGRVSTEMIRLSGGSLNRAIDSAVAEIGRFSGADRCYVFLYDPETETMTNTHEWCAEGISPQIDQLRQVPCSFFPTWMRHFGRFETVSIPRVREVPDGTGQEQAMLLAQGIQSVVAVPMTDEATLLGFVGFDAVSTERAWDREEVKLLELAAQTVSNALLRSRSEAELERTQAELLQARKMEALGRFVGGVAHDFNNLLTVILGGAESAAEVVEDDEVRQQIGAIREAGERAAALTTGLLSLSRKSVVVPESQDVNEVVRREIDLLSRLLGPKVTLVCDLGERLPRAAGSPSEMQQILLNLVVNASEAMTSGGGLRISTRVSEASLDGGDAGKRSIELTVEDEGVGMDEETLAHALEPFFTTRADGEGTGIGLATVHSLAVRRGGDVKIRSEKNRGTAVTVLLPEAIGESAVQPERPPEAAEATRSRHAVVLVVDDEDALRRFVVRALERRSYRVLEASNGRSAIGLLETDGAEIDVVITDLVMRGSSGADVIRCARELDDNLPIIVISGHGESAIALEHALDERVHFVQKPFSLADLGRLVDRLVAAGA